MRSPLFLSLVFIAACGSRSKPLEPAPLDEDVGLEGLGEPEDVATGDASAPEAVILGALDKSLIDEVVQSNESKVRFCYQSQLAEDPSLSGAVTVKFVIAPDGTVNSATTQSSTLASPPVEECINTHFMDFQFPEPKGGGIVIVKYPFVFQAE